MKQPNLKQLESLKQVLKLYQQQLILVQTSFEQQTTVVDRIRQNGILLIDELDDAQNSASRPTANGLELANHLMKSIQSKLSQNEIELNAARLERESIRAELKKLVSKKEALEKLIAEQIALLNHQRRIREQHNADERYLSTRIDN